MAHGLTIAQQNEKLDTKKWEAAKSLVRAYSSWNKIQKAGGPFSNESRDAEEHYRKCLREYRRLAKL